MPKREIKTTLKLDGEKEVKQAINSINREYRVLSSELAAVSSAFGKNQNSVQALTAKNVVLNKEIDAQLKKVLALQAAVKESADKYGEANQKTQGYQIQLNNAKAALNKMNDELSENLAAIEKQSNAFYRAGTVLKTAGDKISDFGGKTKNAGEALTRGLTMPILGAVAAIGALINKSLVAAGEIQKFSDVTGVSAERIQELAYVGKQIDMEYETLISSQAKLTRGMAQAVDGNKQQIEAFRALGVNIVDANGNLRDSRIVMMETIDALNGVGNETERDALALNIFGRSALELNPLIKTGRAELERLSAEAHTVGAVMSNEAVAALDEFGDSVESTKLAIMTMSGQAVREMLPALKSMFDSFKSKGIPAIKDFLKAVVGMIDGFMKMPASTQKFILTLLGIAVAIGPVLTGVGSLISAIGTITTVLGAASTAIAGAGGMMAVLTGPVGIAIAAVAALAAGLVWLTSTESDAADEAKALESQLNSTADAFYKSTEEMNNNAKVADKLVGELETLSSKVNKTNSDNARMATIVSQLNSLYPTLNLLYDQQTGKLNMTTAAIRDSIAARMEEMKYKANEDRLLELYKEREALTIANAKAMERLQAAAKKYNEVGAAGIGGLFHLTEVKETAAAGEAVEILGQQIQLNADGIAAAEAMMYKAVDDANKGIVDSTGKTTILTAEELAKQKADAEKYMAELESRTQKHMDQMGGLSDRRIKQERISAKQIQRNLKQQIKDMTTFETDIARLGKRKGVSKEILKELEDLGPGYDKVIKQLNKMSDKDLAAWMKTWAQKAALAKKTAEKEMGAESTTAADVVATTASKAYADALAAQTPAVTTAAIGLADAAKKGSTVSLVDIGAAAGQSFADGIRSKVDEARAAANALAAVVPVEVRRTLDQHSPSRVMIAEGGDTGGGFVVGILGMIGRARAAGNALARAAIPATDTSGVSDLNIPRRAGSGVVTTSGGRDGIIRHIFSGTVRAEGINDRGQMEAVYDFVVEKIMAEAR